MTIELEGTIKGLSFKPKGKSKDVVGLLMIECHPNELDSGRLSRLAGKDVSITISSRQIGLPRKDQV